MKKRSFFLMVLAVVLLGMGYGLCKFQSYFLSFRDSVYSIGIYSGKDIYNLHPDPGVKNPVIAPEDVTDADARFVADPLMINKGQDWFLFFEVLNRKDGRGDIAVAKSNDLKKWTYDKIVLDEPFHLSFPYVFQSAGEFYMIPESNEVYELRLYKARDFPYNWEKQCVILHGGWVDPAIIFYQNQWWLFVSDRKDVLRLFRSHSLTGPWIEHPKSPIITCNPHIARNGGRVIEINNHLMRFPQDCAPSYGIQVFGCEILILDSLNYEERCLPKPVVSGDGSGWNSRKIHTFDPHFVNGAWIACVDGVERKFVFKPASHVKPAPTFE
jgi:hypothetical protein